jgi:hypothetical protein
VLTGATLDAQHGNFDTLTGSYAHRLEHEIGMSVAPGDSAWRGRVFDAGLVLHRETGSSRDCSAAWAADIVQRVSREGAAASDTASLAHVEGGAGPRLTGCAPLTSDRTCMHLLQLLARDSNGNAARLGATPQKPIWESCFRQANS